jgi:UPF0271 protein
VTFSVGKKGKRAVVLDTSALVAGLDPFSVGEEEYTVPSVREEMAQNSMRWIRLKTAVENGKVKVRMPREAFLRKTRAFASEVGDVFFLSETDLEVLALALELKAAGYSPLIATDDYSIQNVASRMNVEFASLSTFGIRRRLQWIRYCPACHKEYPPNYKSVRCGICGTEMKRKPLKKSSPTIRNPVL